MGCRGALPSLGNASTEVWTGIQVPDKQQSRSAAPLPASSFVGCEGIPSHLFQAALLGGSHQHWVTLCIFPLICTFPFLSLCSLFLSICRAFCWVFAAPFVLQPCANPCQHQPYARDSQEGFAFWRCDRRKPSWIFTLTTGSSAASQIHHQAILHGSLKMGYFLSWGAPSESVEYISMPVPCPQALYSQLFHCWTRSHVSCVLSGVLEGLNERAGCTCTSHAEQASCLGLVFQENRGAGGEIRAFLSGDVSNQANDDIGIRPCLIGLVQEFGSVTWPCLLCFSSNSSIKWSSRISLQMRTWRELAWPHGLALYPDPTTGPSTSLTPPDPSGTQDWTASLCWKITGVTLKRY